MNERRGSLARLQDVAMMGSHQSQKELLSYGIDLDLRVRADHPLRRLHGILDLSFVRAEVARCYGSKDNVSVDPVVLVKWMILLFIEDIASERELMARLPGRRAYLTRASSSAMPRQTRFGVRQGT